MHALNILGNKWMLKKYVRFETRNRTIKKPNRTKRFGFGFQFLKPLVIGYGAVGG